MASAVSLTHVTLGKPMVPDKDRQASERRVFPTEARERLTSYRARLGVEIKWTVTGEGGETSEWKELKDCGLLPVMVKVGYRS